MTRPVVLASGSPYRRELLRRLVPEFAVRSIDVDETPTAAELPAALADRLARAKADAGVQTPGQDIVIGSDQVLDCDGTILGKPGTRVAAQAQLQQLSGRSVDFLTAVYVTDGDECAGALDRTRVTFRSLGADEIERYLEREPALDCAGSFMSEGLGISLCAEINTRDPTALIGLPLIALCGLLRRFGVELP